MDICPKKGLAKAELPTSQRQESQDKHQQGKDHLTKKEPVDKCSSQEVRNICLTKSLKEATNSTDSHLQGTAHHLRDQKSKGHQTSTHTKERATGNQQITPTPGPSNNHDQTQPPCWRHSATKYLKFIIL